MLGEAVGRADDREVGCLPVDVLVGREPLADRVRRDLRVEQVLDRRLDRLVVLGERPVVQRRREEPADALGQS